MALDNEQQVLTQMIPLGSITANADTYGVRLPQKSRIKSVQLVNGAAITNSDTNFADITLRNGATDLAKHSTRVTGALGAPLALNTPSDMILQAAALLDIAAGSWLLVNYAETGTYALTNAFVIINYWPL